jgi:hypothetical protein
VALSPAASSEPLQVQSSVTNPATHLKARQSAVLQVQAQAPYTETLRIKKTTDAATNRRS